MEFIESIKSLDFSRFGLIGSIIGGLFFIVVKVLMMIDRYNSKLFDIIEDQNDQSSEQPPMPKSWTERNRIEK
jgi:hypothetical protein